jgi:2-isopropylmalate synthase
MKDKITILDTTLRDGAQTPGPSEDEWGRFAIAKALAYTGVDVIEAGFAANNADYKTLETVSKYVGSRERSKLDNVPEICSLARLNPGDIRLARISLDYADADRRRIHAFIGTSPELQEYSHGKREKEILRMIKDNVSLARELVGEAGSVQYSSEDSLRTDYSFLAKTVEEAIKWGASVINVPDTTGGARPDQYFDVIKRLKSDVKGAGNATFSAHVHDDLGNAVSSTMKGIEAGIRQIEGCAVGLGERAGNLDWMTAVMNILYHPDFYGVDVSHIKTEEFYPLAQLVSEVIGREIPLNHPIVGEAAFTESSGIHVKGVLSNPRTYYIIRPEDVGRTSKIELGQTSGMNTTANFLRTHGYGEKDANYSAEDLELMTENVKRMSIDVGGSLNETECLVMANEIIRKLKPAGGIELVDYRAVNTLGGKSTELYISAGGKKLHASSDGIGTVDSWMKALNDALGTCGDITLKKWEEKAVYRGKGAPGFEMLDRIEFSDEERSIIGNGDNGYSSKGQEAMAKSTVELEYKGRVYHGRGAAGDITEATYRAIINAADSMAKLGVLRLSGSGDTI